LFTLQSGESEANGENWTVATAETGSETGSAPEAEAWTSTVETESQTSSGEQGGWMEEESGQQAPGAEESGLGMEEEQTGF